MTVVVTGSSGFVGGHVVAGLLAAGHRVVGIDRRMPSEGEPWGWTHMTADLSAPSDEALDALRSADAVLHLAARPGVRAVGPGVEEARHRDNVMATQQVLAAVDPGTPLVVTSSSSVYGGSVGGRPSAEGDRLRPLGGYARSKVEVERACSRRAAAGGLVTVARPFTVVGEGQRPDMALALWVAAARAGAPLRVFGSLDRRRDLTDVVDVARALRVLAERAPVGVVNLGTGRSRRLGELVEAVARTVGRSGGRGGRRPAGARARPDVGRHRAVPGLVWLRAHHRPRPGGGQGGGRPDPACQRKLTEWKGYFTFSA